MPKKNPPPAFDLQRPTSRTPGSRGRAVSEAATAAQRTTISLDDVVLSPLNPAWRNLAEGEDFDRLVASISTTGVLHPPVIVSAAAWRAENPIGAPLVDTAARWVVLDGNRRVLAARAAGLRDIEAIERDDLAGRDAEVMAHTDVRVSLTPMDEARIYRRILDTPKPNGARRVQSDLAAEVGVSQSAIAKRLKLLSLPEWFQGLVGDGFLPATKALDLLGHYSPADLEAAARSLAAEDKDAPDYATLWQAAQAAKHDRELAAAQNRAQELATEHGATYVDDAERIERRRKAIRLTTDTEIRQAGEEGLLLVAADPRQSGEVVFYTTPPADNHAPSPKKRTDHVTHARTAREARWPKTVDLARRQPSVGDLRAVLVRMLNARQNLQPGATAEEVFWAIDRDLGLTDAPSSDDRRAIVKARIAYLEDIATRPHDEAAAWRKIIAWHESRLVWDSSQPAQAQPWRTEAAQWYYDQLTAIGYIPTAWEQQQLERGQA